MVYKLNKRSFTCTFISGSGFKMETCYTVFILSLNEMSIFFFSKVVKGLFYSFLECSLIRLIKRECGTYN